jgi:hypothetical protein
LGFDSVQIALKSADEIRRRNHFAFLSGLMPS